MIFFSIFHSSFASNLMFSYILQEGTIGHNLVVKPVPSSVRHLVSPPDDEIFLDANDEDIENDVTMDTGKRIKDSEKRRRKRRRREVEDKFHTHIVYKRTNAEEEDAFSDYGEDLKS